MLNSGASGRAIDFVKTFLKEQKEQKGKKNSEQINMSNKSFNKGNLPQMKWKDHSEKSLFLYLMRNADKADCSFLVGSGSEYKPTLLKSYQWILSEISPILKRLIEQNRGNNCQLIPLTDIESEEFENFLNYCHTKTVPIMPIRGIFNLYRTAKKYEVEPLIVEITAKLEEISFSEIETLLSEWVDFFELVKSNKTKDTRLDFIFDRIFCTIDAVTAEDIEEPLLNNMSRILDFEEELLYDFFTFIGFRVKPLTCFKVLEYFMKGHNLYADSKQYDRPTSNIQSNIKSSIISSLLKTINLDAMSIDDYHQGPEQSVYLDNNMKEYIMMRIDEKSKIRKK